MDKLFNVFGDFYHAKVGGADSFSDQLSSRYTVGILCLIAILSTTRVFVDEPISCYCPPSFTSSQVSFTNKVCWTTNTHFVAMDRPHVPPEDDPEKKYIAYYQWIPLFLAFQALLFFIPRCIWKKMSTKSGATVSHVTDACIECHRKSDNDAANKIMSYATKYMNRFLIEFNRSYHSNNTMNKMVAVVKGNYLTQLYIIIKIVYIANVIGQLFLLNCFLGKDYHMYGLHVIKRLLKNQPWETSPRFPRVTMCDFYIRTLGNVHRNTVQCALPMNLFYEIIFIFLWFWFVFVAMATSISLVGWIVTVPFFCSQENYIRSRLKAMNRISPEQRKLLKPFVRDHLKRDGCLILKLVSKNASDMIASELIVGIWDHYLLEVKRQSLGPMDQETLMLNPPPPPPGFHSNLGFNDNLRKREETVMREGERTKV